MARYKFYGKKLKQGGTVVANVSRDNIRKGSGSTVVCNISGGKIRNGSGSSVAFNVKSDDIRTGSGSSKIATMKVVHLRFKLRSCDYRARYHVFNQ